MPGDEVAYWLVRIKNGITMYFGYSPDSKDSEKDGYIEAVGKKGKALVWSLRKTQDLLGNYYLIEYLKSSLWEACGEYPVEDSEGISAYYPHRIIYTKNDIKILSKYRIIEFSYEPRSDYEVKYIPTIFLHSARLTGISVMMGECDDESAPLLRKYVLHYESSPLGKSRLAKITEYGSDGVTFLPETTFTYSEENNELLPPFTDAKEALTGNASQYSSHMADIDGDGKTDIVFLGKTRTRIPSRISKFSRRIQHSPTCLRILKTGWGGK